MDETKETNMLLWKNRFLTLLKMNLSEDDFGTLTYLIEKAQKNMLNKRYGVYPAIHEDLQELIKLYNGLNKNLKGESEK